jgi:hypothetical protein
MCIKFTEFDTDSILTGIVTVIDSKHGLEVRTFYDFMFCNTQIQ